MVETQVRGEADALAVLEYIKGILGPSWFKTLNHGTGILFHASRAGNLGILEFLVYHDVDLNITNRFGATALHNAVLVPKTGRRSPYATCKYLLEHGAVLDSSADMSAFHLACSRVDGVETLRLLCFHGASVHETIPITPTRTKWLWGYVDGDKLLALAKISTPLKAVLNNERLDPQESAQFCLQMTQSTDDLTWMIDAVLQSANIELLLSAIRSGSWKALGFDRRDGLLRITMQCCDYFLDPRRSQPCSAFGFGKEVNLDLVKGLLRSRSLSNPTNLDVPTEMAAMGIALYNEKRQLLEVLQENLPTQGLAHTRGRRSGYLEDMEDVINEPLWWHRLWFGSVSCFALDADQETFASVEQQYGWDTICLSLVIEKQDFAKVEVFLNHQSQRQDSFATSVANKYDPFPPLLRAIEAGAPKFVQACVKLGESIHGDWTPWEGYTLLVAALSRGYLAIVDLLLGLGADINQSGRAFFNGPLYTPLQRACSQSYLTIAKRLIDLGADLDAVDDKDGRTALEFSAAFGRVDMV
ncbi:uncharacterized protein PG986_014987 [Apiospora aurea]|uniref:Ankyrin n=1 Tax=Apiospora aurea TaxID=335848 RepID=A0ABR1PUL7_9PEZI